ncbi:ABC transporter permease [Geobacter sp.]|uniref:ABC transporter permease n=1 Tax=Geobacter sp. TaxID=46610 RepID=UPI0027B965FD|nr:ABC transporter permease [Geobacter sp.]
MALKALRRGLPVITAVAFIAVWQVVASFYPPEQFPAPTDVVKALAELSADGVLWRHIGVSLVRFGVAYVLALVTAVPLGLLLGRQPLARRAVDPLIQLLRPISPIAWFPLAVLWFGIGNAPAVFIIFLSTFFPMLVSTISAVVKVPAIYLKVAANFGTRPMSTFLKVVIPAAFPGIMVGLHIAVGTGWIHLVAGEMLGAQSGLGFMIVDARNFLRTDWILAGMLVVGLLGLLINRLMRFAELWLGRRWGGAA